jgi:transcription initiation factor IIE alpha subunit
MATLWKAELTDEMMFHLTSAKQQELRNRLSLAVDTIAAEYKVGKEYKHELRTTTQ